MEKRNCKGQCEQKNLEFSCELDASKKCREQKNLDFSSELNVTDKKCQEKQNCSKCVK